jgi:hypothetical protein
MIVARTPVCVPSAMTQPMVISRMSTRVPPDIMWTVDLGQGSVLGEALARDEIGGASNTGRHPEFAGRQQRAAENLRAFLAAEHSRGHIAAYGAAAKATVLFNVFGIDSPLVGYAVDDSPLKVGRRIPGTSIVIHDVGELARREPATVLVTAWNYAEAIARKHESLSARGTRFATPLPTPRFVESQRASES